MNRTCFPVRIKDAATMSVTLVQMEEKLEAASQLIRDPGTKWTYRKTPGMERADYQDVLEYCTENDKCSIVAFSGTDPNEKTVFYEAVAVFKTSPNAVMALPVDLAIEAVQTAIKACAKVTGT